MWRYVRELFKVSGALAIFLIVIPVILICLFGIVLEIANIIREAL